MHAHQIAKDRLKFLIALLSSPERWGCNNYTMKADPRVHPDGKDGLIAGVLHSKTLR